MAGPQEVSPDVLALNGVLTACEEVTLFACGSGGELRMGGYRVYDTHTHPTQAHMKFNMDQWIPNIEGLRYPLHPFNFAPTLSIHIEYQAPSL